MDVEKLYHILKKVQEPKGYYFNKDRALVNDLLKGLLKNKGQYGYMGCPCRLLCYDRDRDKDIICPCVYREPDVKEFGRCYCNLYVSREWNESPVPSTYVPERRSDDRIISDC